MLPGSGEALWSCEEADERARRQRTTDAGAGARGAPLLEHSGDEDLARRRRGRGLVLQREARGVERGRVRWGSGRAREMAALEEGFEGKRGIEGQS